MSEELREVDRAMLDTLRELALEKARSNKNCDVDLFDVWRERAWLFHQLLTEQPESDNAWRKAVDDELVCCWLGTTDSMNPKQAIAAIGRWHYDLGVSGVCEQPEPDAPQEVEPVRSSLQFWDKTPVEVQRYVEAVEEQRDTLVRLVREYRTGDEAEEEAMFTYAEEVGGVE